MTTTPEYTNEPWSKTLLRMFKGMVKLGSWAVGLAIAVSVALAGYDELDLNGYISHDRTLDVYMTSHWLVGENRVCWLSQVQDAQGKPTAQLDSLHCPVGFENELNLTTCPSPSKVSLTLWTRMATNERLLTSGDVREAVMTSPVKRWLSRLRQIEAVI